MKVLNRMFAHAGLGKDSTAAPASGTATATSLPDGDGAQPKPPGAQLHNVPIVDPVSLAQVANGPVSIASELPSEAAAAAGSSPDSYTHSRPIQAELRHRPVRRYAFPQDPFKVVSMMQSPLGLSQVAFLYSHSRAQ